MGDALPESGDPANGARVQPGRRGVPRSHRPAGAALSILLLIGRRLAISALLIVLLTGATFAIYFALPTEPGRILFGPFVRVSDQQLERANHALGVDRPIVEQYVEYLGRLARGDFGEAWSGGEINADGELEGFPIRPVILDRLRVTGSLVLGGAVLLLLISLPLGVLAATRPSTIFDRTILLLTLVAISTHPIVVGLLLQLLTVNKLDILPPTGYCPMDGGLLQGSPENITCAGVGDWAEHLVMPWISFALFFSALYLRMVRTKMLDVLEEPYVRTARAKGAPERRVLGRHALRNAIAPVLTMLAMDMGAALGIAVYIEAVFRLPGLGLLAVGALAGQSGYDLPLILAVVVVTALAIMLLNLLADVTAAIVDPRLKRGWAAGTQGALRPTV